LILLALAGCASGPPPKPAQKPVEEPVREVRPQKSPDEEIAVSGTLGSLSDEQIAAPFQARWTDLGRCYATEKDKMHWLGGRVELKIRVDGTGAPKTVSVATALGHLPTEKCLLAIARQLKFAAPKGGTEAVFSYPIELNGDQPFRECDESKISRIVPRAKKDASGCAKGSPPKGLAVTIWVGPGGKVVTAGVAADEPVDDKVAGCLVERSRAWKLDDPLGRVARAVVRLP
jgi:hypothetical protein